MIKRIKRISPLQLGKISALGYGIFSVVFIPFMLIFSLISKQSGPGLIIILLLPILYVALGFVGFIIVALVYNLCAKWIGGIEIELED